MLRSETRIEIRPPWPSEAPLCRRILPNALAGAERLFATTADSEEILAAAAWSYVDDHACGLLIEVRPI